ncbi:MAG: condensation domain-containing protein [Bacteroidota bacterium]
MRNEQIESILPLTHMQRALLFHKLQVEEDQGFLQVSFSIWGKLNEKLYKQAWQTVASMHPALRTSIHWEEISKPVQVIAPDVLLPWEYHDWKDYKESELRRRFEALKQKDQQRSLSLNHAPVSRFQLIQSGNTSYYFLWTCHHILLDGWSTLILLQNVWELYGAYQENRTAELDRPPSFKSYMEWSSHQDPTEAEQFWRGWMENFDSPQLLGSPKAKTGESTVYLSREVQLDLALSQKVRSYSAQQGVSLNTLIQGFWGLLLGKWFQTQDVVYGLTVSGRANEFPGIELLAYPLSNLVPARIRFQDTEALPTWLQSLQVQYGSLGAHESTPLSQIHSWIQWSGNTPLFDCLVVFQSLPWTELQIGEVKVHEVKGKTTSVYPLSLLVNAQESVTFTLRYDKERMDNAFVSWASAQLPKLFSLAMETQGALLSDLMVALDTPTPSGSQERVEKSSLKVSGSAESATEVMLAQIWEKTLGIDQVGPEDNFFEVGGTSILAVQVFGEIERQLDKSLPPTSLMTHPTIRALSQLIREEVQEHWASLVRLQSKGSKPPLFVLHDIGGDIFIYKELAKLLGEDQPLYGFQAKGLDGRDSTLQSISELAAYYVEEILRLFPDGPFLLSGISFGGILAYEMGQRLIELGKEPDLLVLFDTYPNPGRFSYGVQGSPTGYRRLGKFDTHMGRLLVEGGKARVKHYGKKAAKVLLTKLPFLSYKEVIPPGRNVRIWNANEVAINSYFMEPIDCRLTLFLADQNYTRFYEDTRLGWSEYALKGLEVHVVPGDHLSIMYPPNVEVLAEKLKVCINRVEEVRGNL